ncbi:hypothetical protein SDC9_198445 [bioreactor metagenome]|uniref:Uncharacterized protein n=1 Tax=bioreactor metagenome TaxID=1076179 RepID=A0A645IIJ9_9ZZZZ
MDGPPIDIHSIDPFTVSLNIPQAEEQHIFGKLVTSNLELLQLKCYNMFTNN